MDGDEPPSIFNLPATTTNRRSRWTWNACRKLTSDTEDMVTMMDRSCTWHARAIQEIIDASTDGPITIWTAQGHRVDIAPKTAGHFSTATAIHHSTARSTRRCTHYQRMTTTEFILRNKASGGRRRAHIINTHLPSAVGHTTDELGDMCRRIEEISHGRRFLRCILGDFHHVLCDPKCGRNNSTAAVGAALRYTTTTATTHDVSAPDRHGQQRASDEDVGDGQGPTNNAAQRRTPHRHQTPDNEQATTILRNRAQPRRRVHYDDRARDAGTQHGGQQHAREVVQGRRGERRGRRPRRRPLRSHGDHNTATQPNTQHLHRHPHRRNTTRRTTTGATMRRNTSASNNDATTTTIHHTPTTNHHHHRCTRDPGGGMEHSLRRGSPAGYFGSRQDLRYQTT